MKRFLSILLFCLLLSGCTSPYGLDTSSAPSWFCESDGDDERNLTATVVEILPEYAVVSPVDGDLLDFVDKVRIPLVELDAIGVAPGDLVIITYSGKLTSVGRIDDAELPYVSAWAWTKIELP